LNLYLLVDGRFAEVSLLRREDGGTLYQAYSAVYNGEKAVVKLLYDNHDSAAVHAAWSAAGLAPPLLASEGVHVLAAERQYVRRCVGQVDYSTDVHMVRCCPM
jgi:hypothetical protein